jgi:hypothetical protein
VDGLHLGAISSNLLSVLWRGTPGLPPGVANPRSPILSRCGQALWVRDPSACLTGPVTTRDRNWPGLRLGAGAGPSGFCGCPSDSLSCCSRRPAKTLRVIPLRLSTPLGLTRSFQLAVSSAFNVARSSVGSNGVALSGCAHRRTLPLTHYALRCIPMR